MEKQFFIERRNEDQTFTVVSRHHDYDSAIAALEVINSPLRHELWSYDWVNTDFGYAPIAWTN